MKKIFLALCVLLSATSAFAFEWRKVLDRDGSTLYVDNQSFQQAQQNPNSSKQIWEKMVMPKQGITVLIKVDIDCQKQTMTRTKGHTYNLSETKLIDKQEIVLSQSDKFPKYNNPYASICYK